VPTIVVSAWARHEERAFAHPTDWFHGIDPLLDLQNHAETRFPAHHCVRDLIYSAIMATGDLSRRPRKESSVMPAPHEIPAGLEVTLVDHPLVNSRLSTMRDIRTDNATFRVALRELTTMLVYEASRNLATERILIDTPVAQTYAVRLTNPPLLVPVLRAGLGMADQAQVLIPDAQMGFVGLARDEVTLLPTSYMESLPKSLSGRQIYALDPMLATGGSMVYAIERLIARGATDVTAICVLAAPEGLARLAKSGLPVRVVTASVDERLNDSGYIVPGLGDAGDRQFGAV
jgi:uracil phosphoribosyltransferase